MRDRAYPPVCWSCIPPEAPGLWRLSRRKLSPKSYSFAEGLNASAAQPARYGPRSSADSVVRSLRGGLHSHWTPITASLPPLPSATVRYLAGEQSRRSPRAAPSPGRAERPDRHGQRLDRYRSDTRTERRLGRARPGRPGVTLRNAWTREGVMAARCCPGAQLRAQGPDAEGGRPTGTCSGGTCQSAGSSLPGRAPGARHRGPSTEYPVG